MDPSISTVPLPSTETNVNEVNTPVVNNGNVPVPQPLPIILTNSSFNNLVVQSSSSSSSPAPNPLPTSTPSPQQQQQHTVPVPLATTTVTNTQQIAIKRKRYLKSDDELDGSNNSRKIYKAYDSEEGVEVAMHRILPSWDTSTTGDCCEEYKRNNDNHDTNCIRNTKLSSLMNDNRIRLHDLEHDHLIKILDSWTEDDGSIIYITPIVTAGTLAMYIARIDEVRFRVVRKWCRQILSGLQYMHNKGTAHGDLRLSNIYINGETGNVLLGNFVVGQTYDSSSLIRILRYTAPENSTGSNTSASSPDNSDETTKTFPDNCITASPAQDVYAFGMCVLEMVTRRIPWAKLVGTPNELSIIMNAKINGIVPPELEELEAKYSNNVSSIIIPSNSSSTVIANTVPSSSSTVTVIGNTGTVPLSSSSESITSTGNVHVFSSNQPNVTVTPTVSPPTSAAATAALTKAEDARAAADLIRKCLAVNPVDRPTVDVLLEHEFLRERKDEQEDRARDRKAATTTVPSTVAMVPASVVAPTPSVPVSVVNPSPVPVPTISTITPVSPSETSTNATVVASAVDISTGNSNLTPIVSTVEEATLGSTGNNGTLQPSSSILGTVTSVTLTQVSIPTPIISSASSVPTNTTNIPNSVAKSSPVKGVPIVNTTGTTNTQTVTNNNPLGSHITITTSSSTIPTPNNQGTPNESTTHISTNVPEAVSNAPVQLTINHAPALVTSSASTLNATVSTSVTTNPIVTTSSTILPSGQPTARSAISSASGSIATVSSISNTANPHVSTNPTITTAPSQTTVVNKNGHSYVVTTTSIPQTPVTTPQTNQKTAGSNNSAIVVTNSSVSAKPSVTNLQPLKLLGLILETIRFISTKQILVSMRLVHPHPRRPETDVLCRYVKFEMNRTDPTDTPAQVAVELVGARLVPMDDMDKAVALLNASLGGILSIPTIYGPEALQSLHDRDYGGNYYRRNYRSRGHTGSVSEGILEDDDRDDDHSDEEDDGDDDHVTEGGAETETHDGRTVGELEDDAQDDEPEIDGDDARSHPSHGAASGGTNPRSVPGRSTRASSLAQALNSNHYDYDERGSVITDKDSVKGGSHRGIRSTEPKSSPSEVSLAHSHSGTHNHPRQLNNSSLSGSQLHRSMIRVDQPLLDSSHNRTHDRTATHDNDSNDIDSVVTGTPYTGGIRSRSASDARGLHNGKSNEIGDTDNDDDNLLSNDDEAPIRLTEDDFSVTNGATRTGNNVVNSTGSRNSNQHSVPVNTSLTVQRTDNLAGENDQASTHHPNTNNMGSSSYSVIHSPSQGNLRPSSAANYNNNTLSRTSTLSAQDSGWSAAHDLPFSQNDINLSLATTLSPIRGRGRTGTSDSINLPSDGGFSTANNNNNKVTVNNATGTHPPTYPSTLHPAMNGSVSGSGGVSRAVLIHPHGSTSSNITNPVPVVVASTSIPSIQGISTATYSKNHTNSSRDPSPTAPTVRTTIPVVTTNITNDPTLSIRRQTALENDPFAHLLSSPLIPRTNISAQHTVTNFSTSTGGAAGILRTSVPSLSGMTSLPPLASNPSVILSNASLLGSNNNILLPSSSTMTSNNILLGMGTGLSSIVNNTTANGSVSTNFLVSTSLPGMSTNNNNNNNALGPLLSSTVNSNLTGTSLSSTALPVSDLEQLFELSNNTSNTGSK